MPPGPRPQIPPTFARVVLSGTYFTHVWAQVFYLALTGSGITSTDLESICDTIKASWTTNVAPQLTNNVQLQSIAITYIPTTGVEVVGVKAYSQNGTSGTTYITDASACFVASWKIGAYYRGGHPRSYIPGILTGEVSNGSTIVGTRAASLTAALEAWRVAINAITTTHVTSVIMGTLSFQRGNAWRTTPLFFPYNSVVVSTTLGSQRRRIRS